MWEWIGTVLVALAGITATAWTGARGREHAERLARMNHEHSHQEDLRKQRLQVYSKALAHALHLEHQLNSVWATSSHGHSIRISPTPPGPALELPPIEDVTIRMRLLADASVEEAWLAFVSAMEQLQWWAEVEGGGDASEEPPDEVIHALRESISQLKKVCRTSLQV